MGFEDFMAVHIYIGDLVGYDNPETEQADLELML
jgi:hypothetical protein